MATATKPRRTRKVATKDIVPKGPCVGFEAVDHLVWCAKAASAPPAVYVNLDAFDKALAADRAAEQYDLGERWTRDIEYDQRESVIRGQRPVSGHAKAAVAQRETPVAVVTATPEGTGAFYRLNSGTGQMEAAPMDDKTKEHMAEFLRLHREQDGPQDDPGPVSPVLDPPRHREDKAGPGSPGEASDETTA